MLEQLQYQANQHELVADNLGTDLAKDIDARLSEVRKELKNTKKDAKVFENSLDKSFKALEDSKLKYLRSHNEHELAKANLEKADSDGSLSTNDITKMKNILLKKTRENDDFKAQYASQLGKTNLVQQVVLIRNELKKQQDKNNDYFIF